MIVRGHSGGDVRGWTEDAVTAMQASPTYFAWWYTVKSVALAGALAGLAYVIGRSHGRRQR